MPEQVIVIEKSGGALASRLAATKPVNAASAKQLHSALDKHPVAICVGQPAPMMKCLVDFDVCSKMSHRVLLLSEPKDEERALLNALFESVVAPNGTVSLLKTDDLIEVVASSRRPNLFLGGFVVPAAKTVVLLRGNLEPLAVPFSLFKARPTGPNPDFSDFEIIDSGQTVRLGKYEAAGDAILYETDPEFRRQEKKRRVSGDRSFGGALRRLRLQRGLSRDDFPGIAAKTIARIERGEVKEPHGGTLSTIAEKLGVKAEDIATY